MEIETIAKKLRMSKEELIREGIRKVVEERLYKVIGKINEIFAKYGIRSAEELEKKIEIGEIPEHPAWEELIDLEYLLEDREFLLGVLRLVEKS